MKFKGIYHAHSTYSADGTRSLAELKALFLQHGIRFAIMTEHAEDMTPESLAAYVAECRALSDKTFLFVPGLEIPYVGKVHVGCFPVAPAPEVPMYAEGIAALRKQNAFAILHHPSKENYYHDAILPALVDGVEVWNSRYEGAVAPSFKTTKFVREKFGHLKRFGGLDFHSENQLAGPRVIIEADDLSPECVVRSFKEGHLTNAGNFFRFTPVSTDTRAMRFLHAVLRMMYVSLRRMFRS